MALRVLIGYLCLWRVTSLGPSICGSKPDAVPGCDKRDMGSCGNACCVVEVALPLTSEQAYQSTKDALQRLGEDGFEYVTGGSPNPADDLRPYNISSPKKFQFILQGRHNAPKYFGANGDILNFAIYEGDAPTSSVLRMFSLSRIHGALGDNGQNYKTLSYLAERMKIQSFLGPLVVKHGCGQELKADAAPAPRSHFLASFPSSCGAGTSEDPNCAKKDFGSCGNACCLAELELQQSPLEVYTQLKSDLESSEKDGFEYVTGGSPNPADDLRPYNISSPKKFQFILQGRHNAPKYFGANGDILNFAIYEGDAPTSSVLRMFSLSRIHGALGDNGQNYKTLSLLAKRLKAAKRVKYGCGTVSELTFA